MSDYETIMVFNETFDFLISSFTTFLSIIFAFLIASALLAERLTRLLAAIAVALFSGASLFFISLCYNVAANLGTLAELIKTAVANNTSELGWVNFVASDAPIGLGLTSLAGLMVLAYGASIVFFVGQRRHAAQSSGQS